ncbi:hypothetical protein BC827DRAFT_470417 [Russula dissimulans]|nr:hypothetical protein BC827DRAFT_470417 [Russula dissimulans]
MKQVILLSQSRSFPQPNLLSPRPHLRGANQIWTQSPRVALRSLRMLPSIMTVHWLAVIVIHPINMKSPSNQLGWYTGQDFKAKAKLGTRREIKEWNAGEILLSIGLIEMKQYPSVTRECMTRIVVISNGYKSIGQHGHVASGCWSLETLGR